MIVNTVGFSSYPVMFINRNKVATSKLIFNIIWNGHVNYSFQI